MKNKLLFIGLAFIFLILLCNLGKSEMTSWSSVSVHEETNSVTHHSYYQYYDDIEELSRGGQLFIDIKRTLLSGRTNNVIVWAIIEPMPYVAPNFTITHCDFNITWTKTDYDSDGNLISSNETKLGYTYSSGGTNTTELYFKLKNRDSLVTDVECYYNTTDPDLLYGYPDDILFGRSGIYLPANKCNDCQEYTLEELSNEIERTDEIIQEETAIYEVIQKIIEYDFKLWLIASWLVKLLLVVGGIFLVFYGIYYLYLFLKDIHDKI